MAPFNTELPYILDEMLATDKGIDMALDHFRRLVVRLEGQAARGEQRLATQTSKFQALSRTRSELQERAERPVDQGPALWHAKLSDELQALEGKTRRERMRGGELEVLEKRVAWEHEQTRKAVERRELDLKGHCQDVATLSTQLNEAQTECAYTFACLDTLCVTLAEQKKRMATAAVQRRQSFKKKADAAARELEEDKGERIRRLRALAAEAERDKMVQRAHITAMMKSGKKLDELPLYSHVAMILMGRRKDLPPKAPVITDPRYTYEETQVLMNSENELNTCQRLMDKTDSIIVRFQDLQLTRVRAQDQIAQHEASIDRLTRDLIRIEQEELDARIAHVRRTETRDIHVALAAASGAHEYARVREQEAQRKVFQKSELLARISDALLSMTTAVGHAVSLEEDGNIIVLAAKLRQAAICARPSVAMAGGDHHSFVEEVLGSLGFSAPSSPSVKTRAEDSTNVSRRDLSSDFALAARAQDKNLAVQPHGGGEGGGGG